MTDIEVITEKASFIRSVEMEIARRYSAAKIRCPVHLSIGQELASAAVCHYLQPGDLLFSTHRNHAHYLAAGGDLKAMLAELYGKQAGCCRGRGGSMHLRTPDGFLMWSGPIVGSALPLALGAAWSLKQQGKSNIVVAFMGDAAVEQGVFHECLLIAHQHKLPVLFVIEENGKSVEATNAQRRSVAPKEIGLAHGVDGMAFDWRISASASSFVALAAIVGAVRGNAAPLLIRMLVDLHAEHCGPAYTIPENDPLTLASVGMIFNIETVFDEVEALPDATAYDPT